MRISLPKGEQKKFIKKILAKISVVEAAEICNLSQRTIRNWRREKFLMDKDAMLKLCDRTNILAPRNFEEKDDYWYIFKGNKIGGKLGALACIKKYGCVGGPKRKEKWYEWWNAKGQYNTIGCIKKALPIKIPRFSTDLAEFTGIMIGDGGISKSQVIISTNKVDDYEYGHFIEKLIKNIFGLKPSIYKSKITKEMDIVVSRKKLVEFCNKNLGLKIGNKLKQGLDIPSWIKTNPEFEKACIRGIMDTDGCIFNESHKIKNKLYSYLRLNITSASSMLRKSIFDILEKNGLSPKIRNNRCIQIEDLEKIKKYFELIGSHNPKHLKRYYK